MKTLKSKIEHELHMLEKHEELREDMQMNRETIDRVCKLSKTLYYLHKACEIMGGKYDHKGVAAM